MNQRYQVVIVGAGPVGLLLANALGAAGVQTLVVEKRRNHLEQSMAIGIMPPSLRILDELGLADEITNQGIKVRRAHVSEEQEALGFLDFTHLPTPYSFLLLNPLPITLSILKTGLRRFPSVEFREAVEFASVSHHDEDIEIGFRQSSPPVRAAFLVGCDGHKSAVRSAIGLRTRSRAYRHRFHMADFEDHTDLGDEVHLYFNAGGPVESFPLPGRRRRWIAMGDRNLGEQIQQLSGHDLSGSRQLDYSEFQPARMLVDHYTRGRVALCGDAAHVMSPIGGQGMNTGFADAHLLAGLLPELLRTPAHRDTAFAHYDQVRRRAFAVAANRAAYGMWLGTRTGQVASRLRAALIGNLLFRHSMQPRVAAHFAMLTIPSAP
jgi:2-polyprenyl-6-methoxyphenol hydroxylase-like FAD-dependent oxidoreductase